MCVLRVSGAQFDVDAYLSTSGMVPCTVFRVGTSRSSSRPGGRKCKESGFNVDVSDATWANVVDQVKDACVFLERHQAELRALRTCPGVEDVRLDFPVELRIGRNDILLQVDYFPPELVTAAGSLGLGLELSIYPCSDDEDEDEEATGDSPGGSSDRP